jgi:hypothetical protein
MVDNHEGLGIPRGGTKETLFHCPQRGMLVQFEEPFDAPHTADGNIIVAGTRKRRDAYGKHRVLVAEDAFHVHGEFPVFVFGGGTLDNP